MINVLLVFLEDNDNTPLRVSCLHFNNLTIFGPLTYIHEQCFAYYRQHEKYRNDTFKRLIAR